MGTLGDAARTVGARGSLLGLLIASLVPSHAQELRPSAEPASIPQIHEEKASLLKPSFPEVTYRNGQLTIHAVDSTLADVLNAVAERTGAAIDIPPGSGLERIIEEAGPGPADDIISRLLNGSPFDFVIVGSPESPHVPTQVLLFRREVRLPPGPVTQLVTTATATQQEPELYGAGFSVALGHDDAPPLADSSQPTTDNGSDADRIPGAVLDQMQKERLRLRQLQMQQQQPAAPSAAAQ